MNAAVHIRPARPEDAGDILAMIRELAAYEQLEDAVTASVDRLRATLFGSEAVAEALVAEGPAGLAGYAVVFRTYSTFLAAPGLYLEDLFVRPASRGQGIGTALFRAVAALAVARGCARLEWSVLDWNTPALDFYRAHGAQSLDDWTVHRLTGEALRRLAAAR